jgi:hypothetical protein
LSRRREERCHFTISSAMIMIISAIGHHDDSICDRDKKNHVFDHAPPSPCSFPLPPQFTPRISSISLTLSRGSRDDDRRDRRRSPSPRGRGGRSPSPGRRRRSPSPRCTARAAPVSGCFK